MTTELHRLMFDRFCEMLNCEVPIEEYSEEIIKTILRAGYAVVPAAPRPEPRVEREPVAWRYEYLSSIQKWLTEYSNTKPPESACFRNIVPLYAAPPIEREPSDEDLGGMTGAELCGGDS